MIQKMLLSLLVAALPLAGCAAEEGDALPTTSQAGEDAMQEQTGETGANAALLQEESEVRAGTSADTLAAPADFLQEYDYGSGRYDEQSRETMYRRLPEPEGNATVGNTAADPAKIQALYLWEEGNMPAQTEIPSDRRGNFDPPDFRPYVTAIPVRQGTEVKGAVVLLAGGAFQIRGNYTDTLPTAAHLRELGYQTFIVDYRLRPYTQQEGALDVARAVRFVRQNAEAYGIDPDDIAVMGYSAGGIQAGEFFLRFDEERQRYGPGPRLCARCAGCRSRPCFCRRHDLFFLWTPQRGLYGRRGIKSRRLAAHILLLWHGRPLLPPI